MQKRIISAIITLIIIIPIILKGGFIFNIAVYLIGLLGLKEFLDAKSTKKEVPILIRIISYIFMSLIILVDVSCFILSFLASSSSISRP